MGKVENYVSRAIEIAQDDRYGYSQYYRDKPFNYDCSKLVITVIKEQGIAVDKAGASYTGDMYDAFLKSGFIDVSSSVNFKTGRGLQRGDVLLKPRAHTEIYVGDGKVVGAMYDEVGDIKGAKQGDQTGREIMVTNYYNYPWTYALRYIGDDTMIDIDKALKRMDDHHRSKGYYPYSMVQRYGNPGYDCSSSVYYALKAAGRKSNISWIGNTETLFKEPNFKEIMDYKDVQAGDIFIRGGEGTSSGAGGHTGMFYKKDGIVHSNYTNNGISYNDNDSYIDYYLDRRRSASERYFRPIDPNDKGDRKPTAELVKEVIAGKRGVGQDRVLKLQSAGYDYRKVQDAVNASLKGAPVTYKVKAGDTLSKIATAHKVSVDSILKDNPSIKNANLIKVGQEIKIK